MNPRKAAGEAHSEQLRVVPKRAPEEVDSDRAFRAENLVNRAAGVLFIVASLIYLVWLAPNLNWSQTLIASLYLFVNVTFVISLSLSLFNHWTMRRPNLHTVLSGREPCVGVIIPTCGEPVDMVRRTALSVLRQDYPLSKLTLVVSDDRRVPELRMAIEQLATDHPDATILYHEPYRRTDLRRRGEAKAGNLNSAMDLLDSLSLDLDFIETRDADDLVGDPRFLRSAVGELLSDQGLAFVQTIKSAVVAPGDPFGNCNPSFYQAEMFARNSTQSVFPCGSGLLWRREALEDIGRFPDWNMVEDLQSGVEALRRRWRGSCLPLVGALAQVAPEDLQNMYKQRGVWALDAMRLLFWGSFSGMTWRQRLHFHETSVFYLLSFSWISLTALTAITLLIDEPLLSGSALGYTWRFWLCFAAMQLVSFARSFGHSFEGWWRGIQVSINLAPLWAWQTLKALAGGPNRKPTYRVTRKVRDDSLQLWYVIPQVVCVLLLGSSIVLHLRSVQSIEEVDVVGLFWALILTAIFASWIPRAWFGRSTIASKRWSQFWLASVSRLFMGYQPANPAPVPYETLPEVVGRTSSWGLSFLEDDIIDLRTAPTRPPRVRLEAAPPPLRIAILGGGAAGLTASHTLRATSHEVHVYEQAGEIGGMASSFVFNEVNCDLGPHRLLLPNQSISDVFHDLTPLESVNRQSQVRFRGKTLQDPINGIEYVARQLPRSIRTAASYVRRPKLIEPRSFADVVRGRYGDALLNEFFTPYAEKLFNLDVDQISPDWAQKKLRVGGLRDIVGRSGRLYFDKFHYPSAGGYGAIVNALAKRVDHLHLHHELTRIRALPYGYELEFQTPEGVTVQPFDAVISTLPLTKTAELLGRRVPPLTYQPLTLHFLACGVERLSTNHWTYFCDPADQNVVNRLTEFANFPGNPRKASTVVCAETTVVEGADPDRVIADLAQDGILDPSLVFDVRTITVGHAYPRFTRESQQADDVIESLEALPGLFIHGRSGRFEQRDLDQLLEDAEGRLANDLHSWWQTHASGRLAETDAIAEPVSA